MPETLTSANFTETIAGSDRPVLVDFTASWCGPCKTLAPILDEISAERDDVVITKVDIDASPELAAAHRVMGVPTMIVFKDGHPAWSVTGARPKEFITKELDAIV